MKFSLFVYNILDLIKTVVFLICHIKFSSCLCNAHTPVIMKQRLFLSDINTENENNIQLSITVKIKANSKLFKLIIAVTK